MKTAYLWTALYVLLTAAFIGYEIYAYNQGKAGNPTYVPTYNFVHHPSFQNFRILYASWLNDPITEILLVTIFALFPFPFLPSYLHNRLELVFAKIGLFYMIGYAILGSPQFSPSPRTPSQVFVSSILVFGIIALFIASLLYYTGVVKSVAI